MVSTPTNREPSSSSTARLFFPRATRYVRALLDRGRELGHGGLLSPLAGGVKRDLGALVSRLCGLCKQCPSPLTLPRAQRKDPSLGVEFILTPRWVASGLSSLTCKVEVMVELTLPGGRGEEASPSAVGQHHVACIPL